jgi:cation transport protein ChaC
MTGGGTHWVFGYGSLMWNPGFPHIGAQPARISGFHRKLCVYSFHYRGTPEKARSRFRPGPGRFLHGHGL